jgi:hypothetical protein
MNWYTILRLYTSLLLKIIVVQLLLFLICFVRASCEGFPLGGNNGWLSLVVCNKGKADKQER